MSSGGATQICAVITNRLKQLPMAQSGCTIYKVHRPLRDVNHKAYEPEIIAIGPYHRDKDHLKMLEEHKFRYLRILFQSNEENVRRCVSAIGQLEEESRSCYAEPIPLSPGEFTEMLVLDGCFIVELVRKFNNADLREENDPIFNLNWIMKSLQRDLMLFENQIPFFILCKLLELIEVPNQHNDFMYQVFSFSYDLYPGKVRRQRSNRGPDKTEHLLDLIHNNWLPWSDELLNLGEGTKDTRKSLQFINNTAGLREASVKFKRNEGGTLFDVHFKNGTLSMPPLTIDDWTESFFRNLIAFEQYSHDIQSSFLTDYVKFMDCLIDSSRDVEILSNCGIINNWLGDDKVVANMFNKLTDSVTRPEDLFFYAKTINGVNIHCNRLGNKWMAKLRRSYWNSPWVVLPILVAVILLLLTVTQTVFSVLQVVLHP